MYETVKNAKPVDTLTTPWPRNYKSSRHLGPVPYDQRTSQFLVGRARLLHKMDRGQIVGNHHYPNC
ncbi:hypothetical protein CR513_61927, partial [Mucuna pruriens]